MTDVRCIEHVIRDGSDFDGQKEWRVYISYEEGKQLFLPANLAGEMCDHQEDTHTPRGTAYL